MEKDDGERGPGMAVRAADEITQRIRRPHVLPRGSASVVVDPALTTQVNESRPTRKLDSADLAALISPRPTRKLTDLNVAVEVVESVDIEPAAKRVAHTVKRTPAGGTPTVPMPVADLAAGSTPELPKLAMGTTKIVAITVPAPHSRWRDIAIGFAIGAAMIGAAMIGLFA
jgi:hypothetical protein